MNFCRAVLLLSVAYLAIAQEVDYCFTVDGGCGNCVGKWETDFWGDRTDCVWCRDGSFSDCDTRDSCFGTPTTDCSVAFDGTAIGAIIIAVIFGVGLLLNLWCVCAAVKASNHAREHQSKYNFSFEGYVKMRDVLPSKVCDYAEPALDEREKNELVWIGASVRSDSFKIGCGIGAILPPLFGIIIALIAWLVVGTLIYFIGAFMFAFIMCLVVMLMLGKYRKPAVYCMTPREAIIIADNGCGSVFATRFPYVDMPSVDTVHSADGLGSIYFASRLVRTKHGYRTVRVGFESILNCRQVETKMKELKAMCSTTTVTIVTPGQPMMFMTPNGQTVMMTPNGMPMNGQVIMTNGQPMMMSPTGQPVMMTPNAQPMYTQPNAQPVMMNPNGQPVMTNAQPMYAQPMTPNAQPVPQQPPVYPQNPEYNPQTQTSPPPYSQ